MNIQSQVEITRMSDSADLKPIEISAAKAAEKVKSVAALYGKGQIKSVSGWGQEWLASKKFYLLDVPLSKIAVVTIPKLQASAKESTVIVDVNKNEIGGATSGFVPPVIVVFGAEHHIKARELRRQTITAWIGELAAKKLGLSTDKSNVVEPVRPLRELAPMATSMSAALDLHAGAVTKNATSGNPVKESPGSGVGPRVEEKEVHYPVGKVYSKEKVSGKIITKKKMKAADTPGKTLRKNLEKSGLHRSEAYKNAQDMESKKEIYADDEIGQQELNMRLTELLQERLPKPNNGSPIGGYITETYPFENYFIYQYKGEFFRQRFKLDPVARKVALEGKPQQVTQKFVDVKATAVGTYNDMGTLLTLRAGGPGSGRHPEANRARQMSKEFGYKLGTVKDHGIGRFAQTIHTMNHPDGHKLVISHGPRSVENFWRINSPTRGQLAEGDLNNDGLRHLGNALKDIHRE